MSEGAFCRGMWVNRLADANQRQIFCKSINIVYNIHLSNTLISTLLSGQSIPDELNYNQEKIAFCLSKYNSYMACFIVTNYKDKTIDSNTCSVFVAENRGIAPFNLCKSHIPPNGLENEAVMGSMLNVMFNHSTFALFVCLCQRDVPAIKHYENLPIQRFFSVKIENVIGEFSIFSIC